MRTSSANLSPQSTDRRDAPAFLLSALLVVGALIAGVLMCADANAQPLRDPTQPPAALASAPTGVSADDTTGFDLIRGADGRLRLMTGGRLLSVGQMLGSARIVRLSEREVWLSEAGQTRKISRTPQVSIQLADRTPQPAAPTRRVVAPKTP